MRPPKLTLSMTLPLRTGNVCVVSHCLHVGPVLTSFIFDVLLRFKCNKVALVGDIEKAFLNIEIDAKDRDCLRFL